MEQLALPLFDCREAVDVPLPFGDPPLVPRYRAIMGKLDGMLPHVPTAEMVANHPWHVYDNDSKLSGSLAIAFTGNRAECEAWIAQRSQRSEPTC